VRIEQRFSAPTPETDMPGQFTVFISGFGRSIVLRRSTFNASSQRALGGLELGD